MSTYKISIEYEIEAETHEDAARQLADMFDEGLFYRPVCDVTDEHGITVQIDTEDF